MSIAPSMVVPVGDLRHHPGARRDLSREFVAEGMTLREIGVPDGSVIRFEGHLEAVTDGVIVGGSVTVPWVGVCRRCLGQVEGVATGEIQEVWSLHPIEEEDQWLLENDEIDLGPILRDAALLALPLAPLCSEDCRGPAPDMFPTGIPGEETEPRRDPRWAALDDLDLDR